MRSDNSKGSRAAWGRAFMALCAIMLAIGLGLMASRAEAAPFAYVANFFDGVSVIDTATNTVVATVLLPVGSFPFGVAVTPGGTQCLCRE